MLEELKNLNSPGQKEDILFFLQSIVGNKFLTVNDIKMICSHAPGKYQLIVEQLISYCHCFDLIQVDAFIHLDEEMIQLIGSPELMNDELISRTVNTLFIEGIFRPDLFFYDFLQERFVFKNESFPLCFSSVRNVLISQTFFELERKQRVLFYINQRYERVLANYCQKYNDTISLERLKKKLERNAELGELAERFVLEYEKKRLAGHALLSKVRIISEIDVCAGYDIVSFDNAYSSVYDRFIEVKAISENEGFFWSSNELNVAKIKESKYYLYLVDLSRVENEDYEPLIIVNPGRTIMESSDWLVETQTYHVKHI